MTRETNHSKHPSSARRRREIHLERDAAIKTRKRERLYRGEIHETMLEATKIVEASMQPQLAVGPFRAPDKKDASGAWMIFDANDRPVAFATSRDKARAVAKDADSNTTPIVLQAGEPLDHDEAMLRLGWRRVAANKDESVETSFKSIPIDEKFEWVGVQP